MTLNVNQVYINRTELISYNRSEFNIFITSRPGNCPSFGSSMTQTELLQELANECRYDKMVRPPGVINETDPIRIYTKAFIYTIRSNMAKTLVSA